MTAVSRAHRSVVTLVQDIAAKYDHPVVPNYFRYLTLMALHVFLEEKVGLLVLGFRASFTD